MAVVPAMMRAEPRLLQRLRRGKLPGRRGVLEFRSKLLELARLGGIALGRRRLSLILELRRHPRRNLLEQCGILLLDLLEHAQKARGRRNTGQIALRRAGRKRVRCRAIDAVARLEGDRKQTGESVNHHARRVALSQPCRMRRKQKTCRKKRAPIPRQAANL